MLVFGGVGHLEKGPTTPDPYGNENDHPWFFPQYHGPWDVLLQVAEVTTNGHMFVPRVSSSFPAVSKVRIGLLFFFFSGVWGEGFSNKRGFHMLEVISEICVK